DVVAYRDRALLAVRDGAHAVRVDAARHQILADRLGAAGAARGVVLARAALAGLTPAGEAVLRIVLPPLRLLVERRPRLRGQLGRVDLEEDAVAHIDHEVLRAARNRGAGAASVGLLAVRVVGARPEADDRRHHGGQLRDAEDARDTRHSGGSPQKA